MNESLANITLDTGAGVLEGLFMVAIVTSFGAYIGGVIGLKLNNVAIGASFGGVFAFIFSVIIALMI